MTDRQPQTGLTTTQKTGFVLLLIFGILTIGLAGLQLRNNIYGPFAEKMAMARAVENVQLDESARLQMVDTDHDTLTDWEEINFYNTSPYLPDTDSDGIADGVEIKNGTNPLCPEGQICNEEEQVLESASSTPSINNPLVDTSVNPANLVQTSLGQNVSTSGTQGVDFSSLSAMLGDKQKLRELLLQSGAISADQLSKIDDNTLDQILNQVLQQQVETVSNTLR